MQEIFGSLNLNTPSQWLENEKIIFKISAKTLKLYEHYLTVSEFSKETSQEIANHMKLSIDPTTYLDHNQRMLLVSACKNSRLLSTLLSRIYSSGDFDKRVSDRRLFFVELGKPTEFVSGHSDPLNELEELGNYILKKVEENQEVPQSLQRAGLKTISKWSKKYYKQKQILLLIQNFEQLSHQIRQGGQTKEKAIRIFKLLKHLNSKRTVNIIAVGYDSKYAEHILSELGLSANDVDLRKGYVPTGEFQRLLKEQFEKHKDSFHKHFTSKVPEDFYNLVPDLQERVKEPSSLQPLIDQIQFSAVDPEIFFKLIHYIPRCLPNKEKMDFKNFVEKTRENIKTYLGNWTEQRNHYFKSKILRTNDGDITARVRLLSKVIIDLEQKEKQGKKFCLKSEESSHLMEDAEYRLYSKLCKQQILFDFKFYSEDYRREFQKMIREIPDIASIYQDEKKKRKVA